MSSTPVRGRNSSVFSNYKLRPSPPTEYLCPPSRPSKQPSNSVERAIIRGLHRECDEAYADAEQSYNDAITRSTKKYGYKNQHTFDAVRRLCRCLHRQEKYAEVEKLASLWIPLADEPYRRRLRFDLLAALFRKGDFVRAREEFKNWKAESVGFDDLDIIDKMRIFGRILIGIGALEEAKNVMEDAVFELRERTEFRGVGNLLFWWGYIQYRQRQWWESEESFRRVIKSQKHTTNKGDMTLHCTYMLVVVLASQRKFQEAESECRVALRLTRSFRSTNRLDEVREAHFLRRLQKLLTKIELEGGASTPKENLLISQNSDTRPMLKPNERLDLLFQEGPVGKAYTDPEISEISRLLRYSKACGCKVPRTYIVLRYMDCLHMLEPMVNARFSDFHFPVTARNLPPCLSPGQKARFIELQSMVLTPSMDLEKGKDGTHCTFSDDQSIPLQRQKLLGRGGFGEVDKVLSLNTFKEYARKRVPRPSMFRHKGGIECMSQLAEEIKILKRLKHHHIVEYIGSYTSPTDVGLIMTPIANTNLANYLEDVGNDDVPELRTFFGCLASGLEYLHVSQVRHKDIKPNNILIHQGRILFADFSLSFDFLEADGSTSVSMVNGTTPRYCAPEVSGRLPRNTSSDVWSLGIVFLEMITVIKGRTVESMNEFFQTHGTEHEYVRANPEAFNQYTQELRKLKRKSDNAPLEWVEKMLELESKKRPTAASLLELILGARGELSSSVFCGLCCSRED